ncbi:MAG: hypothetical protein Ta2A_02320 [Treponemataceae bacterium]|nr:MAG: hypothetical protein Ta2A_02320 [Treponemataceae bacterium]
MDVAIDTAFSRVIYWLMVTAQIASLMPRGQITLPKSIRSQLSLSAETQFAVFSDGENVLLKPLKAPDTMQFKRLLDDAQQWAAEVGLTEADIKSAVADVHLNSKASV